MMKRSMLTLILVMAFMGIATQNGASQTTKPAPSKVYFTREISPEALVKIYKALGREATGRVAVKISTGEGGNKHYLKPDLIRNLVEEVNGTIVECNTAYAGTRNSTAAHWQTIHDHGFDSIFVVDLMDEYGEMKIPVKDHTHLKYDIVGDHLARYTFMINLAHFKGHAMGGYGGVLKNQSIGVASSAGKAYIHSAGYTSDVNEAWSHIDDQDGFLESMAAAAQGVADYFGDNILYISVLNNMSVDCDCAGNAEEPKLKDMGIMASLDPVALDWACVEKVFNYQGKPGDDNRPLTERIQSRHGTHTIDWAEHIGMGTKNYVIVDIDK